MRIQHAVIMAAGRGQRMMPLTQTVPKPLAPYLDTTLLGHGIKRIKEHVPNVHITVGYKAARVAKHAMAMGANTVINTDGKESCWWVFGSLLRHVDAPVFVLTCDNVTDVDFQEIEDDYYASGAPTCMVVPARPIEGFDGDYIFSNDHRRVTKLSRHEKSDAYCSGIQVINPGIVASSLSFVGEECTFYDVWQRLIDSNELMVSSVFPKNWMAIDTVADLAKLNKDTPVCRCRALDAFSDGSWFGPCYDGKNHRASCPVAKHAMASAKWPCGKPMYPEGK